jgi:protein-disulfide isomerase
MKWIYLVSFLFSLLFLNTTTASAAEPPTEHMISMMRSLEQHAMKYGNGDIKVYVFVDPKCPHSRDFISMIYDSDKMKSIYRYYIFLYELKRLKSHKQIGTIYASSSPLQKTLEVMVSGREIKEIVTLPPEVEEKIGDIENVAQQLDIQKRPYLIIAKDWK